MDLFERRLVIYTAFSKYFFFAKMLISSFVLDAGCIPLNPFNNWEYFMDDMVERNLVIRGNNNLILLADELWTFGPIADGVFAEVKFAKMLGKSIRHFSIGRNIDDIRSLSNNELVFEEELLRKFEKCTILSEFDL